MSQLVLFATTRFAPDKVLCDTWKNGLIASASTATSARPSSALTSFSWWTTIQHVKNAARIWIPMKNKILSRFIVFLLFASLQRAWALNQ
jgi:hypothetical protein